MTRSLLNRVAATLLLLLPAVACAGNPMAAVGADPAAFSAAVPPVYDVQGAVEKLQRGDAEWRTMLSPAEYQILRQEGTEWAFTGDLWDHHGEGVYVCAGCGLPLFASGHKFESGTGWPSYTQPVDKRNVAEVRDASHGMVRVEVECARCGGHLGHVFPDGPAPTGLRYCINSASLDFVGAVASPAAAATAH